MLRRGNGATGWPTVLVGVSGMRAYGEIYSISTALMILAGGLGPIVGGIVFDRAGSYTPLLLAGIVYSVAVGSMVATLGRYPSFERPSPA